jgi:uncharacterized membrane protein YeaQ/YmgE (transglycosylase-associated protein family)
MGFFELIGLLIGGLIIGFLGRVVAPSAKDKIPMWATLLCGVAGILVGDVIYRAFGGNGSAGVDWTRWIVAVLVSAGFVVLANALLGGRSKTRI